MHSTANTAAAAKCNDALGLPLSKLHYACRNVDPARAAVVPKLLCKLWNTTCYKWKHGVWLELSFEVALAAMYAYVFKHSTTTTAPRAAPRASASSRRDDNLSNVVETLDYLCVLLKSSHQPLALATLLRLGNIVYCAQKHLAVYRGQNGSEPLSRACSNVLDAWFERDDRSLRTWNMLKEILCDYESTKLVLDNAAAASADLAARVGATHELLTRHKCQYEADKQALNELSTKHRRIKIQTVNARRILKVVPLRLRRIVEETTSLLKDAQTRIKTSFQELNRLMQLFDTQLAQLEHATGAELQARHNHDAAQVQLSQVRLTLGVCLLQQDNFDHYCKENAAASV